MFGANDVNAREAAQINPPNMVTTRQPKRLISLAAARPKKQMKDMANEPTRAVETVNKNIDL